MLYAPLLLLIILLVVQFTMVWFGNQAASGIARETARHARIHHDIGAAQHAGNQYADNIGSGVLDNHEIHIRFVDSNRIRVVVTGRPKQLVPFGVPRIRQAVEGPIEEFQRE